MTLSIYELGLLFVSFLSMFPKSNFLHRLAVQLEEFQNLCKLVFQFIGWLFQLISFDWNESGLPISYSRNALRWSKWIRIQTSQFHSIGLPEYDLQRTVQFLYLRHEKNSSALFISIHIIRNFGSGSLRTFYWFIGRTYIKSVSSTGHCRCCYQGR